MSGQVPMLRLRWALDVYGPGCIYVLDTKRASPKFGRRVAGPFGNEAQAADWIDRKAQEEAATINSAFSGCAEAVEGTVCPGCGEIMQDDHYACETMEVGR